MAEPAPAPIVEYLTRSRDALQAALDDRSVVATVGAIAE